jgi:hypothetical protein
MSTALANFLKNNEYSLGMEEYTDGEQKLEVHVASEPSVDHDLAELAEAELKQDEIARDCDTAMEMYVGMEAYHDLLCNALDNGGISAETAAFMQVAVEQYEVQFSTDTPVMPSLEAFGGSSSRQISTQASAEGFKEKMKQLWEATKKILKALLNMLKDVVTKATYAAERLEKRAEEVAKKAGGMGSTTSRKTDKITLKGGGSLERVFLDGKYVGDDILTTAGVFAEVNVNLPKNLAKYISDAASVIQGINPSEPLTVNSMNALLDLDDVRKSFKAAKVINDKRFPSGTDVYRSQTMPGNMAVFMTTPSAESKEQQLADLQSKGKLVLLPVVEAKKAPTEHEVKVGDVSELRTRAQRIKDTANKIVNSKKDYAALENAIAQAMDAGDKLSKKAESAEMDKATETAVKHTLRGIMVIQRMSGNVNGILSHSVRTLNSQLAIVERELAAYGSTAVTTTD